MVTSDASIATHPFGPAANESDVDAGAFFCYLRANLRGDILESTVGKISPGDRSHNRVFFLDVVRLLSLLMIICYHFDAGINDVHPGARIVGKLVVLQQGVGDIGVTLFIMISGAALMLRREENFSAIDFFKKRFLAIYPAYWICYLAISVFLFYVRGAAQGRGEYWKFILTFFALDGYFGNIVQNDYYLVGEWFVGFILIMYLFFPLLRGLPYRNPIFTGVVLLILAGILGHFYKFPIPKIRNPLMRLPDLFFGMCFVRYIFPYKRFVIPAAFVIIIIYATGKIWLPAEYVGLLVGATIFCIVTFISEYIPAKSFVAPYITRASKLAFIAFLVHHWVIYLTLQRIDASQLSFVEVYYLFSIVIGLSFGIAALLERPVSNLTESLANGLLFRHR